MVYSVKIILYIYIYIYHTYLKTVYIILFYRQATIKGAYLLINFNIHSKYNVVSTVSCSKEKTKGIVLKIYYLVDESHNK